MKKIKYLFIILLFIIIYIIFAPVLMHKAYTRDYAMKQNISYINENFSSVSKFNKIINKCKEDEKIRSNIIGLVDTYLYICYSHESDYINKINEIRKLCKKNITKENLEKFLLDCKVQNQQKLK